MEINGQIIGVLKDVNGRDLPMEYIKAGNDNVVDYYRVDAYRHVNDQRILVGYDCTHNEPTMFEISTVIRTFNADYAEVAHVYETFEMNFD